MQSEDKRCLEARQFARIDAAFAAGDLAALRAAVDDPAAVPNGVMPLSAGTCLVYAIYHSPIAFIRELLAMGADPGAGFPPLIAALSKTHPHPGSPARDDVAAVLELLLAFGANPNQRGLNDYTALHMAVAERNLEAVEILLAAGADRMIKTRIDECETPPRWRAAPASRRLRAAWRALEAGREILQGTP